MAKQTMHTTQITTRNVRDVALALKALAGHGPICATAIGHVGVPSKEQKGVLGVCRIIRSALECRIGTGPTIRIPYTVRGFRPVENGDVMACYRIETDGVVVIRYRSKWNGEDLEGYRHFKLA